ncbi:MULTISPECIES: oxidoreductase [Streptomyces]|jgi:NAD(P)-dependent dehydrogenase (short-subunit alcohol dehydrogenase family)|uniref:SDR family NAD(P)-dependent oxidoreductase n=3 Tax=Streptomyces griseoaurantiacus TaxID=68213 RepID=A0A7W2DP74_9ACTN|nr:MULTISPECIES: oxidoreductase [Streptomyces]EGG44241.1 putative short chain dehydrogenase [Streptomyces griseoaurantiacus M045]MBA5220439.1 SDR family NAD(P)-dependent oxidoreductase [Streptomyces griseoaurantiacus]MDX3086963.1 oxidoreductase [Streptomyces sp. ME12-02E]MDX3330640.1 oxidoreductase [Streptomyces sp. ME02-6978a]WTI29754.1 oxidoreductase [Streptomyces jietaisiensis]
MTAWTADRIPDQHGRVAVVTGANSGLGLLTATELARRGARVVLAVRDTEAGREAARRIGGDTEVRHLDLASLASVRAFAEKLSADHPVIDLLINNAGLVLLGPRHTTADGFELHLGTNMLGHFALTGLLLGNLAAAPAARVVSLSSITHKNAHLDFDDLMCERNYKAPEAYSRSKLATTAYGVELDRRLRAAGSPVLSVLAHPGLTRTNLTPRAWEHRGRLGAFVARAGLLATQPVEQGVLPQLRAATDPEVRGGQFFGPGGLGETRGRVVEARLGREAGDPGIARRLWETAERLTGVTCL